MEVVYIETWQMDGLYDIIHDRVEISEYLKLYPELHDFVLKHETTHAKIQKEHGLSWRHFWLDVKDRFSLFNNKKLWKQYKEFRKQRQAQNVWQIMFIMLYQFVNAFTALVYPFIVVRHYLNKTRVLLLSMVVIAFLYRAYPHMFLIPRWRPEEEFNYVTVNNLVTTGSLRQLQFYPVLTHYTVYGLWLLLWLLLGRINLNPVTIAQYFNPFIGALTVLPIFLLMKEYLTEKQSLLVCLFWSLSEASFYRTAYFGSTEALALFFGIFAFYFYQKKNYVFTVVSTILSFASHLLPGLFVVVGIFLHKFFFGTRKEKVIATLVTFGTVLLIMSPFSPHQRLLSSINPYTTLSNVSLSNLTLYSLTDLVVGVTIFLGTLVLGFFAFLSLSTEKLQNKFLFAMLLSVSLVFVFSWIGYSPNVFAPPRLTLYFVVPLSYYAVKSFNHLSSPRTLTLLVLLICSCMVLSSVKGLQPMLWVNDSLSENEYKALDELEGLGYFNNTETWWSDYSGIVSITVRQPIIWLQVNETKMVTYFLSLLNVETDYSRYVFYSERIHDNGFFVVWRGIDDKRTLLIHKPIQDMWKTAENWELKFNKYGVKVYERLG